MARETGREAIVRRLSLLMRYVVERRYLPSGPQLARELGVSLRTARRYLATVRSAGWVFKGDGIA